MKRELSIEVVHAPGDGLLAQVTAALHRSLVSPECLVWSSIPDSGEARIWITLAEPEAMLLELAAALDRIPGVLRVIQLGPGGAPQRLLSQKRPGRPTPQPTCPP